MKTTRAIIYTLGVIVAVNAVAVADETSLGNNAIVSSLGGTTDTASNTSNINTPVDVGPVTPIDDQAGGNGTVENSPEPATLTLLGLGGSGALRRCVGARRRRLESSLSSPPTKQLIRIDSAREAHPRAAARRSRVAVVHQRFLQPRKVRVMNRQSRWILSIAAVLFAGAMAHAKDVVLQDGGVVVGSTETTPIPVATPPVPTDNVPGTNDTTGTKDRPSRRR